MIDIIRGLQRMLTGTSPIVFLVLRILIGYGFFRAGYGKIGNLEGVESYFASLGIPAPGINALVVSVCEMGCGILLMLGLGTRLAAIVGLGVLGVAVLTAHMGELTAFFSEPGKLVTSDPMPYIMLFLVFAVKGPGSLSVDKVIGLEGSNR